MTARACVCGRPLGPIDQQRCLDCRTARDDRRREGMEKRRASRQRDAGPRRATRNGAPRHAVCQMCGAAEKPERARFCTPCRAVRRLTLHEGTRAGLGPVTLAPLPPRPADGRTVRCGSCGAQYGTWITDPAPCPMCTTPAALFVPAPPSTPNRRRVA